MVHRELNTHTDYGDQDIRCEISKIILERRIGRLATLGDFTTVFPEAKTVRAYGTARNKRDTMQNNRATRKDKWKEWISHGLKFTLR